MQRSYKIFGFSCESRIYSVSAYAKSFAFQVTYYLYIIIKLVFLKASIQIFVSFGAKLYS
jgi:hypothetical protein